MRITFGAAFGLTLLAASTLPAAAATLTNDFFVRTSARTCYPSGESCLPGSGLTPTAFTDVSVGGFNSTGGFDSAESRFAHASFGLFALGAVNTTDGFQQAGGDAQGVYQESVLIPDQPGLVSGDAGELDLTFHLHGQVNVNWSGFAHGAGVRFAWSISRQDLDGTNSQTPLNMNNFWYDSANQTIDQDVLVPVSFTVGKTFYLVFTVLDDAWIGSAAIQGAEVGSAQGDFLHTGVEGPGVVRDKFGNVVTNAIVQSDTGFDYLNPQGAPAAGAPEPATAALSTPLLGVLLVYRARLRRKAPLVERHDAISTQ